MSAGLRTGTPSGLLLSNHRWCLASSVGQEHLAGSSCACCSGLAQCAWLFFLGTLGVILSVQSEPPIQGPSLVSCPLVPSLHLWCFLNLAWFGAPSCCDFRGFSPCHSFLCPLAAPPWFVLSSGKPHTLFCSLRPCGFPWPLQPLPSAPPLWFFSCCVFCPSLHGVSKSSAFHPSSFPDCVCPSLPDTAPSPM